MKAIVYSISCPILKRIIYVGASYSFNTRKKAHRCGNYRTEIGKYVKSLRLMGYFPIFDIIEEYHINNHLETYKMYAREQFYIDLFTGDGIELLNQKYGTAGVGTKSKKK